MGRRDAYWIVKGRRVGLPELEFNHLLNISLFLKRNPRHPQVGFLGEMINEVNKRMGEMSGEEKKKYVKRTLELLLPRYNFNKEDIDLQIEEHPKECAITSIREVLPPNIWEEIEKNIIKEKGEKCEICGNGKEESFLFVDYGWEIGKRGERYGQVLKKIRVLCDSCYGTVRYGNPMSKTRRWEVVNKLMEVNKWNEEKAQQYIGVCLDKRRDREKSDSIALNGPLYINIQMISKYHNHSRITIEGDNKHIVAVENNLDRLTDRIERKLKKLSKDWYT